MRFQKFYPLLLLTCFANQNTLSFCVNPFPASSSSHLLVNKRIYQLAMKYWCSENYTSCRQIYTLKKKGAKITESIMRWKLFFKPSIETKLGNELATVYWETSRPTSNENSFAGCGPKNEKDKRTNYLGG